MAMKTLTLEPKNRSHMKKLEEHLNDGWEIVSQEKRGLIAFKPGQIDYVLRKA